MAGTAHHQLIWLRPAAPKSDANIDAVSLIGRSHRGAGTAPGALVPPYPPPPALSPLALARGVESVLRGARALFLIIFLTIANPPLSASIAVPAVRDDDDDDVPPARPPRGCVVRVRGEDDALCC
eukprot:COSAG01_NODE_836_length_13206_cov_139.627375_17_plen_125_part_00